MFESDRNLYLNADKTKVVEEGDPEAAYVLVAAGGRIHLEDAEKFGLVVRGGQGATHKAADGYDGATIHAFADPGVRRVEMASNIASKAGTPEGGDGYPSKHPELDRSDFDEAHDEDAVLTEEQGKADEAAKKAAKEEADRQTAQAEKIKADEEKAREEAARLAEEGERARSGRGK